MATDSMSTLEMPRGARRRPLVPSGSGRARWAGRVGLAVVALVTLACVAVAGATVVHRARLWPVRSAAPDVGIAHESLLVLVPVPAGKIRSGDLVVIDRKDTRTTELYRVDAVVSQVSPAVEVRDDSHKSLALNLPATVWRVSYEVPFVGAVVKVLPGSIVAWTLIPLGVLLVGWSRWLRRRRERARDRIVTPAPSA